MNLSVRLGKALHIVNFNIVLLDTYESALKHAGELLGIDLIGRPASWVRQTEIVEASSSKGFSRKIKYDDFAFSVEVLKNNIIHSVTTGVLKDQYIDPIFNQVKAPGSRPYEIGFIQDYVDELMHFVGSIEWDKDGVHKKIEIDKISFDLRLLIEDVTTSIAMRARNHGLEFASHISPGLPASLVGDPGKLRQILNNLAGNDAARGRRYCRAESDGR